MAGGGCSLLRTAPPASSAPPLAEIAAAPPAAAPLAAAPPAAAPASPPVYRNPTIGMVYLRAHQDVEGRLLGPQVMYQVVDSGGWNLEALDGGHGSVLPSNREPAPENGSLSGDHPPLVPKPGPAFDANPGHKPPDN